MRTLAAPLAALVFALPAAAANTPADHAQATLRDGCAQSYASYSAFYPPGSPAPAFSGERSKGDNRYYSDARPCDDTQYSAYLAKADPAIVAIAHPSAAGKPKDNKVKKPGSTAAKPK